MLSQKVRKRTVEPKENRRKGIIKIKAEIVEVVNIK